MIVLKRACRAPIQPVLAMRTMAPSRSGPQLDAESVPARLKRNADNKMICIGVCKLSVRFSRSAFPAGRARACSMDASKKRKNAATPSHQMQLASSASAPISSAANRKKSGHKRRQEAQDTFELSLRDRIEESDVYTQLLDFERKLDRNLTRRRADVEVSYRGHALPTQTRLGAGECLCGRMYLALQCVSLADCASSPTTRRSRCSKPPGP